MTGSITDWLDAYRNGDRQAVDALWAEYYPRLVDAARSILRRRTGTLKDDEDIALSAFDAFCSAMEGGRLPNLRDRHDLWRLLISLAYRKAIDDHRRHNSLRRRQRIEPGRNGAGLRLEDIVGHEPSPDACAQAADTLAVLLGSLGDAQLQKIAIYKMEGRTVDEIAKAMGCARTTIERKLRRIRHEWMERVA